MNVGRIIFILVLAAVFTLISCGRRYAEDGRVGQPAPEAGPVWEYIRRASPYTEWHFFPGHEGMYPGQSPHGAYLKLYVNDIAYNAIVNEKDLPEGAMLVKENYAADRQTLVALTPMYKVRGYNPDAGDWFWAEYGPGGAVLAAGKVDVCIECHRLIGGDEFIITTPR